MNEDTFEAVTVTANNSAAGIEGSRIRTSAQRQAEREQERNSSFALELGLLSLDAFERNGIDCYTAEIFAVAYLGNRQSVARRKAKLKVGRWNFSMQKIGKKHYQAAKVAISRSIRRLEERVLITVHFGYTLWTGIALTESGLEVAKEFPPDWAQY